MQIREKANYGNGFVALNSALRFALDQLYNMIIDHTTELYDMHDH